MTLYPYTNWDGGLVEVHEDEELVKAPKAIQDLV